jgi:5'-3' exonuclease
MARIDEAEIVRRYGIPGRAYADFAVLRGDPSDGLPGVKGVGEKTAAALLATHGSLEGVVAAAREGASAGALAKVAAHLDYVERATQVVRIPRDLPLPDLDISRPDGTADADIVARAESLGLGGALDRLLTALAGRR